MEECGRLAEAGVSVDVANADGLTALHQAAIDGEEVVAAWLVGRGAALDAHDNEGWTPLHAAASCGHSAIVRLLLSAGKHC